MTMLNAMWQKISGKQLPAIADEPASPSATDASNTVAATYSIQSRPDFLPDKYLPLWKLQSQRQIIEVKVNGNDRSYQTVILAIDIQRGILWLDDLFPTQHCIEVGDEITLRHHRNGKQLCFSSPAVALGEDYGASGIAIVLPDEVSYQSRRQDIRCDLSHKSPITVKIRPVGQDASYGTLQDISLGGLRLSVSGNLIQQLRHGELVPVCEFKLSDDLHICCSARIRAFRMEKSAHRCTHISIEFLDMPLEKQMLLQQFIVSLQHPPMRLRSFSQLELPPAFA